jgi:hypothetical protein
MASLAAMAPLDLTRCEVGSFQNVLNVLNTLLGCYCRRIFFYSTATLCGNMCRIAKQSPQYTFMHVVGFVQASPTVVGDIQYAANMTYNANQIDCPPNVFYRILKQAGVFPCVVLAGVVCVPPFVLRNIVDVTIRNILDWLIIVHIVSWGNSVSYCETSDQHMPWHAMVCLYHTLGTQGISHHTRPTYKTICLVLNTQFAVNHIY